MKFIRDLFKNEPPKRVRITKGNIGSWPSFAKLLEDGKIKFDRNGRLRYNHGAPVGDLILTRINKDGTPKYKESAEEWFDPDGEMARNFSWP